MQALIGACNVDDSPYDIFEAVISKHHDKLFFAEILMVLLEKFEGNKLYHKLYKKVCSNDTLTEAQIKRLSG